VKVLVHPGHPHRVAFNGYGEPALMLVAWLFERGLFVAILSPKNVRFEHRDPDLILAWHICNM
jgi:hypothetical protein